MNYLSEINAFERWLETNHLPALSQLLWYKLLALFNRSGWREWITVDNRRLMSLIQVGREATFIDLRNNLIEKGLLFYHKGKKGAPSRYKMSYLTFTGEANPAVQGAANAQGYSVAQTADSIRQRQRERKEETRQAPLSPLGEPLGPEDPLRCVLQEFEACIHVPRPGETEVLRQLCERYSASSVERAIQEARGKGRSANYVKTVLEAWEASPKPPRERGSSYAPSYDLEAYERECIFDDLPPL